MNIERVKEKATLQVKEEYRKVVDILKPFERYLNEKKIEVLFGVAPWIGQKIGFKFHLKLFVPDEAVDNFLKLELLCKTKEKKDFHIDVFDVFRDGKLQSKHIKEKIICHLTFI